MQGGREFSPCADEIRTFCQPSPVGEGGSRRLTDEMSFLDKATFPLWYFSVTKSTKSHQRERSPLFENSSPCHGDANQRTACIGSFPACTSQSRKPCVESACSKWPMVQVVSFALPATSYYHACEHITRKSRADSCTHCLHAR